MLYTPLPQIRYSYAAHWIGLLIVVSVLFAPPSKADSQDQAGLNAGPTGSTLSECDLQATKALIAMTRDAKLISENFSNIMSTTRDTSTRLDHIVLEQEFRGRFCRSWKNWYHEAVDSVKALQCLPSSQLQTICWLAQCNKRMCFDMPEVRTRQRQAIMSFVRKSLSEASEPGQICALLDIAYQAVFYVDWEWVVPRDGADDVIDLFKSYVGHADVSVHEYARERLRTMGYVWRSRYKEIIQFLIERAPEIREYLTAKPIPGVAVDIPTGKDSHFPPVKEEDWFALDKMEPSALGAVVEEKYIAVYRALSDCLGDKALSLLIHYGSRDVGERGEAAVQTLAGLIRKGIEVGILRYFSFETVADIPPDLNVLVQRRLNELVSAFVEDAKSSRKKEHFERKPDGVLKNAVETIERMQKKGFANGKPIDEAVSLQVEQKLTDALKALNGKQQ